MINIPNIPHGEFFAMEGLDRVKEHATAFCANQQRHIEALNRPEIQQLRVRGSWLYELQQSLRTKLAELERNHRHRPCRSRWWNLGVTVTLTIAAYIFMAITFDPFQFGWKGYLYSTGLAIVGAFAIDFFLREWPHPMVVKVTSAVLLSAAIPTIALFAIVRGDVFAHSMKETDAPVVDDATMDQPLPLDDTLPRAILILRLAMVLAALGLELAAGLALYEFRNAQQIAEDDQVPALHERLAGVDAELLVVIHRMADLEMQPTAYAARFWSDFYVGLIKRVTHGAMSRNLLALLILTAATLPAIRAADQLDLVIPLDLSQTELTKEAPRISEFGENVRAVATLLNALPPASHATVVAVTGDSFATPNILLSARVPEDAGPFSSRLFSARRIILAAWRKKSDGLAASFLRTDLVGAITYSATILSASGARRKVMVILSDTRNDAGGLDLETPKQIDVSAALKYIDNHRLAAPLAGVEVYVFGAGAHAGDKDSDYWRGLQAFWKQYFGRSGATLRWFSPGRERAVLLQAVSGANPTNASLGTPPSTR